jgi:hypothetical protein
MTSWSVVAVAETPTRRRQPSFALKRLLWCIVVCVVCIGGCIPTVYGFATTPTPSHKHPHWRKSVTNSVVKVHTARTSTSIMPATTRLTLVQFLNLPGLKALGLIVSDPNMILPAIHVPHLQALDLDELKTQGIECIVFDKDNTLSYCYSDVIHPSVVPVVEKACMLFPNAIAILSNSAGSCDDVGFEMAIKTEKNIGLPVIRHEIKKPGCLKEVYDCYIVCACDLP